MINEQLKRPKQLCFAFMTETEKKVILSEKEHKELIQALSELILTCVKEDRFIKTKEPHDE